MPYGRHGMSPETLAGRASLRIKGVQELHESGRHDDDLRRRLPVASG
jgi:hypothetical protein